MPNFQRLTPGGKLTKFPSREWNELLSLAKRQQSAPGLKAGKLLRDNYGVVLHVVNTAGHDYKMYDPVHLDGTNILPADNPDEFESRPLLDIETTVSGAGCRGNWGIALDRIPAEANAVGRVLISGITAARVTKRAGTDLFVDTGGTSTSSDDYLLSTRAAGGAKLLWLEDVEDDEEGWAIINVLGHQVADCPRWASLSADLHAIGHGSGEEVSAAIMRLTPTNTLTTSGSPRSVKVRCLDIPSGKKLPSGAVVWIVPEPISGKWEVHRSRGCLVNA